jgi:tRNA(fMet)-specific endonuclease VapC
VILDTNAVSALADGAPALLAALADVERLSLPVIVLGEFRFGAAQSRHRARYESWLTRLAAASQVLPVDEETARHYAVLRERLRAAGRPIPSNDAWIAALALQHRLPVLSRDRHFDVVAEVRRVGW